MTMTTIKRIYVVFEGVVLCWTPASRLSIIITSNSCDVSQPRMAWNDRVTVTDPKNHRVRRRGERRRGPDKVSKAPAGRGRRRSFRLYAPVTHTLPVVVISFLGHLIIPSVYPTRGSTIGPATMRFSTSLTVHHRDVTMRAPVFLMTSNDLNLRLLPWLDVY